MRRLMFVTLCLLGAGLSAIPAPAQSSAEQQAAAPDYQVAVEQAAVSGYQVAAERPAVDCQNKMTRQERMTGWKGDMQEFNDGSASDRKVARELDSLAWIIAEDVINRKTFVIEAETVTFKRGERVFVNSTTNFVSVNGDRAVVQVSPSKFSSGPNGVGGITLDGRISGYEVKTGRKGNIYVTMTVTGIGINARVDITLYKGSDRAVVNVSPSFNSRTVRMEGTVVPYEHTRTFKGMSI